MKNVNVLTKTTIMKNISLTFFILIIFISSCNVDGMWKDDKIDSNVRTQIHKLNYQLIDGLLENNSEKVLSIFSEDMIEQNEFDLNMLMQQVKENFAKEGFEILNDFYLSNISENSQVSVTTGSSGDHDYIIDFKALSSEAYVSVGYFDKNLYHTCLTLVYGKYGKEWKLNMLLVGALRIMNKDAFDWYQSAKFNYEKGYLFDAANDMVLANSILKPGDKFWQYQKEKEIQDFEQKVKAEIYAKYTFPILIDFVKSKPQIFRIHPQSMNNEYFPMIHYTTTIDLKDTLKLSKECDEIHSGIGELLNGIDKNKKLIIYRACKSIPTGAFPVETYVFLREIKSGL
ncbi:MAG TPA: hypothetical protein VMV47_10455 [Bacteroidales bacterium]|nr:hypothetical protein [Bacteroidales bacterium]